jgi:c-di-GMP-binding flagellar brake protein YcgR
MERRQTKRLEYRARVEIKLYSVDGRSELANKTLACEIADVSAGGVRFVSESEIPVGTHLKLRIAISDPPSAFSHEADVRWAHSVNGRGGFAVGVQFTGSVEHMEEWRRVVEHIAELSSPDQGRKPR